MALINMKKCPHCGRTTWQEFVPISPPGISYWRCRECGDRREAPRVCVDEDVLLHRGRIQTPAACTDVCIINISRGGARLRLDENAPLALATDDRLLFNAQLQPFGELSRYLAGTVRWTRGKDFGLAFDHPLSLSVADIMRIIKN